MQANFFLLERRKSGKLEGGRRGRNWDMNKCKLIYKLEVVR